LKALKLNFSDSRLDENLFAAIFKTWGANLKNIHTLSLSLFNSRINFENLVELLEKINGFRSLKAFKLNLRAIINGRLGDEQLELLKESLRKLRPAFSKLEKLTLDLS